jgi:hypothetical protein
MYDAKTKGIYKKVYSVPDLGDLFVDTPTDIEALAVIVERASGLKLT